MQKFFDLQFLKFFDENLFKILNYREICQTGNRSLRQLSLQKLSFKILTVNLIVKKQSSLLNFIKYCLFENFGTEKLEFF